MAIRSIPPATEPLGPSLAVLRKPDPRTEAEELRMEVTAAGQEMRAMAERISNALVAGHYRTAQHYAARLWVLGDGYADPEGRGK